MSIIHKSKSDERPNLFCKKDNFDKISCKYNKKNPTNKFNYIDNNFLQAYEISKMNLKADLVVLSACETGYGAYKKGEGIISLGRSFMYAGVPALVVSLWSVNDVSTSVLMQFFMRT